MTPSLYITLFVKTFTFKGLFLKPSAAIPFAATGFLFALTTTQKALLLLTFVFVLDFFTGIYAAYIEQKKSEAVPDGKRSFFFKMSVLRRTISSEKLRRSVVKGVAYMAIILLSYLIEKVFFIKELSFTSISEKTYAFNVVIIGFCVFAESWSVVMENLPRAGFDLVGTLTGAFTKAKKIKDGIEL